MLGTVLGFGLGLVMRIRFWPLRWILVAFVDVIRSIPVLVLLIIANYFLPGIIGRPELSPFAIATTVLTVNLCCFVADVVRGAFAHVPAGEIEAARAVGLTETQVLMRFVLPRVTQLIIPTLTLLYIATIKNSSLASVIAVYDLAHVANLISTVRYRTLEPFIAMTALYLILIMPLTLMARRLEAAYGSAEGIGE